MDHQRVVELLDLWGQWSRACRIGPPRRPTCGSAEGQHVAEAGEIFEPEAVELRVRVPDDVGLRVERAVVNAGNPWRDAIKAAYVDGLPVTVIARRLGLPDAGRVLDEAHAAVAARLR